MDDQQTQSFSQPGTGVEETPPAPDLQADQPESVQPEPLQPEPLQPEPVQPVQPVRPVPPLSQTTTHVSPPPTIVTPPPPKVVSPPAPIETASEYQDRLIKGEQLKEVKGVKRTYKLESVVGVLFGSIESALALRLMFKLFGAKATNAFISLLYQFTGIFTNPFDGIFGGNPMFGRFELDLASIIGMVVYAIVGFGALQLTKLF